MSEVDIFNELLKGYKFQCENANVEPEIIHKNAIVIRDFWGRFNGIYEVVVKNKIRSEPNKKPDDFRSADYLKEIRDFIMEGGKRSKLSLLPFIADRLNNIIAILERMDKRQQEFADRGGD